MNTAHVFRDEGDDRIRKALVVPVVLDDEHRADFGPAPVSVRVIKEDDITELHGFRS
jgi:hypothetical protein